MLSERIGNIVRSLVGSSIAERDRAFTLEVQAALNRLAMEGLGRSDAVVHVLSELYISEASRRLQLVWFELKRVVTDVGTPYSATLNDDLTAEFDSHTEVILPLKQPVETQIRNSGFGSDLPNFDSLVKPTIERVHGEIGLFVLAMERNLPAQPEGANAANQVAEKVGIPRAFLSHSSEDKQLVMRLAMRLRASGIDAWLDEWEIKPGDSLRQRIEEGIEKATHFLVILTPDSLRSEWVRTELDAGMVKRIKGTCVLIPVLHRITADQVPATLSGIKWVRIESDCTGFKELVEAILGVSTKPPLGSAPTAAAEITAHQLGLSPNAGKLAALLSKRSETGIALDPLLNAEEVLRVLELTEDQVSLAADELEEHGLVQLHRSLNQGSIGFARISPTARFFIKTDPHLRGWFPNHDARSLAAVILTKSNEGLSMAEADQLLGWGPRRINPAAQYLHDNGQANCLGSLNSDPYAFVHILVTPKTKQFASS